MTAPSEKSGKCGLLRGIKLRFQNLRVAQKLMLISIFFVMPDSLMLYLFITGINANIEFARMEMKGNAYQRPLEDLLELVPQHRLLAERAGSGDDLVRARLLHKEAQIDGAFDALQEVDSRLGVDLQFTDEGLAKRKREHFRVRTVRAEWNELKSQLAQLGHQALAEQHQHLVADVRMMITHAGDLSNLILDPDLDSYYLMDATLLALPQTQDRLSRAIAEGQTVLHEQTTSAEDRQRFAISATMLQEADLDRIAGSLETGLNEDRNFYGISASLQSRLPAALREYTTLAKEFIALTTRLAGEKSPDVSAREYVAAGSLAREASFALWRITADEMDNLLRVRIISYERRRARSLFVAALAGLAACGFVTFITRSISGPLRAQALELQTANEALKGEIVERKRAETGLRHSEAQLAAAQQIARIGSWNWEVASGKMTWSEENYRIHGYEPHAVAATYELVLSSIHPEDREMSDEVFRAAVREGESFSFEQRIVLRNGTERVLHQRGAVVRDSAGAVAEIFGTAQDITERKAADEQLEKAHRKLIEVSRQAGMAEVATGVLHNVGNVLNSVNVSALVISERLSKSRVAHLAQVCTLLQENAGDLAGFITRDPKGRKLPAFLSSLAERLTVEQADLLREAGMLSKNITHIKDIVAMQQNYASVSGVEEALAAVSLIEDALEMNGAAFERHRVETVREFADVPLVRVDKHKVLQILINVLRNAKYAVSESPRLDKRITLRVGLHESGQVQIAISDNGIGIAPGNLARIFAHGFTTKKDGHGFGLHSSALAAVEMGGSLVATSEGAGQGATFTLNLPAGETRRSILKETVPACLLIPT